MKTNESIITESSKLPDHRARLAAAMTLEALPFVAFSVSPEYLGENGLWNPRDGNSPLEAAFQVNLYGTREHYLRLAEAIRQFAEQDTSSDGDHHEHVEGMLSSNGKVRLHAILRKDDVGDATWR